MSIFLIECGAFRGFNLMRNSTTYNLYKIALMASPLDVAKDSVILKAGEPSKALYFIMEGTVKLIQVTVTGLARASCCRPWRDRILHTKTIVSGWRAPQRLRQKLSTLGSFSCSPDNNPNPHGTLQSASIPASTVPSIPAVHAPPQHLLFDCFHPPSALHPRAFHTCGGVFVLLCAFGFLCCLPSR